MILCYLQSLTFGITDLNHNFHCRLEGAEGASGLSSLHAIGCDMAAMAQALPHFVHLTRLQLEHCEGEGLDVSVLPALRELQLVECAGEVVGAERFGLAQGGARAAGGSSEAEAGAATSESEDVASDSEADSEPGSLGSEAED